MSVLDKTLGLVLLTGLCVSTTGCKSKGAAPNSPDSLDSLDMASEQKAASGQEDPLAELDALEGRMLELGLPVARSQEAAGAEAGSSAADSPDDATLANDEDGEAELDASVEESEPAPEAAPVAADASAGEGPRRDELDDPCMDLCGLSESICDLEVRICSLSESHAGDPIYADACERAVDDCDTAGDACDHCGS